MAFNFAAFASGLAEQVSESIDEDSKRVKLIMDKAWDRHTDRYLAKRDKEEAKTELVEKAIGRLSQLTNGNVDQAASLYKKIGNVEDANAFFTNAQTLKSAGGDLSGYIGQLPDDYKDSGMSIKDYAKAFQTDVSFESFQPELAGMITRPDALGGLGEKRVSTEFTRRTQRLKESGLLPADLRKADVTFVDIGKVDVNSLAMPKSNEAAKNILTQAYIKAESRGDEDGMNKAMDGLRSLNTIKNIAEGGNEEIEKVKGYQTDLNTFISQKIRLNAQKLKENGILSFNEGKPDAILNSELYKQFIDKELGGYANNTYRKRLSGKSLDLFNEAYNNVISSFGVQVALDDTNKKNKDITFNKKGIPAKLNDTILKDLIRQKGATVMIDSLVAQGVDKAIAEQKVFSLSTQSPQ
jgi:hypothetical protein